MKYMLGDYSMSLIAWFVYTCVRYWLGGDLMLRQGHSTLWRFLKAENVAIGFVVFPLVMMGSIGLL